MAEPIEKFFEWIDEFRGIAGEHSVAIDDGGLTFVVLDGNTTVGSFEIGGIPEDDEEDKRNMPYYCSRCNSRFKTLTQLNDHPCIPPRIPPRDWSVEQGKGR